MTSSSGAARPCAAISVRYAPEVKGAVREVRDAEYVELHGGPDMATIRTEYTTTELVSFTLGRSDALVRGCAYSRAYRSRLRQTQALPDDRRQARLIERVEAQPGRRANRSAHKSVTTSTPSARIEALSSP